MCPFSGASLVAVIPSGLGGAECDFDVVVFVLYVCSVGGGCDNGAVETRNLVRSHGEYCDVYTRTALAGYDEYDVPPLVGFAPIDEVGEGESGVWGDVYCWRRGVNWK